MQRSKGSGLNPRKLIGGCVTTFKVCRKEGLLPSGRHYVREGGQTDLTCL